VEPTLLSGPLQQFQATVYREDDILRLLQSINHKQKEDDRISDDVLKREFEKWWPDLQCKLDKIPTTAATETGTGFDWLYATDDIARIEADETCENIWIVTQDLYKQSLAPAIKNVVQQNIHRGVRYTFITPPSEDIANVRKALSQPTSKIPDQVRYQVVNREEFTRLAATNYRIINPDDKAPHVYFELPTEVRGFWIEVDGEAVLNYVARFRDLAERVDSQLDAKASTDIKRTSLETVLLHAPTAGATLSHGVRPHHRR
jgi:hypothetical protein